MKKSLLFLSDGALVAVRAARAVIFDMDGVITDTEPIHAKAEWETCRQFGLNVDLSEWAKFQGRTAEDIFAEIRFRFGDEESPTVSELVKCKTSTYLDMARRDGLPGIPGAVEFIRYLHGRCFRLALATSSNSAIQAEVFRQLGLTPCFEAVVTGDDIVRGKPDPQAYLVAAERLGIPPEECLVIEDSDNGIRAAVAAGCTVIGLTTSFGPAKLHSFGARVVASDYRALGGLFLHLDTLV